MTHNYRKLSLLTSNQDLWEMLVKGKKVHMREKDVIGDVASIQLTNGGIEVVGYIGLSIEEDRAVEEYLKLRKLLSSKLSATHKNN